MATDAEKWLSKEQLMPKEERDAIAAQRMKHLTANKGAGDSYELSMMAFRDIPPLLRNIDHLESLLAVAVGALRKQWVDGYKPILREASERFRQERINQFCGHACLTLEQFAALKLGEGE